jgi:predicted nucleic acid-binding protein
MPRSILLDTNVLVYLTNPLSPFHRAARTALLRYADEQLVVSSQILREYASVMSSHPPFDRAALATNLQRFQQFHVLFDTAQSFQQWERLREHDAVAGRNVYDCNIVVTMLANNISSLLTHNTKDFTRYASEIELLPLIPEIAQ